MTSPNQETVLVAVDGSRESMRSLPLARTIAAQLHCVPTVLHVAPVSLPMEKARANLGLDVADLTALPLRLRVGDPADCILDEAAGPEVQLLVMTTVAAGNPERELGSVAMRVALGTSRPILGLRPEAGMEPSAVAPPLHRLLLPLDGSRSTASALRPVASLARRLGASVDVLCIVPPGAAPPDDQRGSIVAPRYVDQPQHEWASWIQELKERLIVECAGVSPGADVGVDIRQGDPGAEIVRFAREGHYDAVVLVRRSNLEPRRAQTLRTVIQRSPCPILVVGGPP
jgi:nucleotide-binding universal stress UspA family protein